MKFADSLNPRYRHFGSRIMDDDISRHTPLMIVALEAASVRRAATYVCSRATSKEDAAQLLDMLGLTKPLVESMQLVE